MLQSYFRKAYRDRRRLGLALVLNLAAGHLGYGVLPDPFPLVPSEVLVVLAFLALVPILTYRFRSKRHWVELVSLGNVIVTAHGHFWPGGFFGWTDVLFMLTLQIPAYIGLLAALRIALYGRWSDALTLRHSIVVSATLRTRLPLTDLWYGMVPTPGFADHNPDREVVSIQFADTTKRLIRLVTWMPPRAGTGEVLIQYDDLVPLEYARFQLRVTEGTQDPDAEGETELLFEDRGDIRLLRLRHKVNGFTPRRILAGYFDDTFGRLMAARLDALETRSRTGHPAKTEIPFNTWFDAGETRTSLQPAANGYRTAYGRNRSEDETRALAAIGRI